MSVESVEEAFAKDWSLLQVLVSVRSVDDALELPTQIPLTAKQPAERLMPLAWVEVEAPVTLREET